jgi:hypothetical protein
MFLRDVFGHVFPLKEIKKKSNQLFKQLKIESNVMDQNSLLYVPDRLCFCLEITNTDGTDVGILE